MQLKPYLVLKRLVIESNEGIVVYDQTFHNGLNIIRGNNSSGKSTIANFIFYSLGGDFQRWTPEARACRWVYAETELSGAVLTLRRHITDQGQQPMDIFWGDYEESMKIGLPGWKQFPYKQTQSKESFSTVLFSALGFPEVTTAEESKITMHQVLRLVYIDQDSPTRNLFRAETFDDPITRRTIAELLLGVYDDSLYLDRLALRVAKQESAEKQQEFNAIKRIFGASGQEIDSTRIQQEIEGTRNLLVKLEKEQQALRVKRVEARRNSTPQIVRLSADMGELKQAVNDLVTEIQQMELDIADSREFIDTLRKKLKALDESVATRHALGQITLEYCPLCLNPLAEAADEGHCLLCKQPLSSDIDKTFGKRLQLEIRQQIRESEKLLHEKERTLSKRRSDLAPLVERLNLAQRNLDLLEREHTSTREQRLDDLLIEKGRMENRVEVLVQQLEAVKELERLRAELEALASTIKRLEDQIAIRQDAGAENYAIALSAIKDIARRVLHRDLNYQAEFQLAVEVEVDFAADSYSLDGQTSFSASSLVYLKNAVRFAVFFGSLELANFRYPRFILCDNTEDKGMQMDRSQNFQRIIKEFSESYNVQHQIILTTSMIDPSLNNDSYCIGDFYNATNKSLSMTGAS